MRWRNQLKTQEYQDIDKQLSAKELPKRSEQNINDCWDKQSWFKDEQDWEKELESLQKKIKDFTALPPIDGDVVGLKKTLDFLMEAQQQLEALAVYAQMFMSEDLSNPKANQAYSRFMSIYSEFLAEKSFLEPRLYALDDQYWQQWFKQESLQDYHIYLKKLYRYKKYSLDEKQERLLALASEKNQIIEQSFEQLTNVDVYFEDMEMPEGKQFLSSGNFIVYLENKNRSIRQQAYEKYYQFFDQHKHTLATLLKGSMLEDVYSAKVRGFSSALEQSLYSDNISLGFIEHLVEKIHQNLPLLHQYYALKKRILKEKDFAHYDVYVPVVDLPEVDIPYEQAVEMILASLEPMGSDYQKVVRQGLLEQRWVDRYENQGKRSGAFCIHAYKAPFPYVLCNYNRKTPQSVFTLTHEMGHAMHSYFCQKSNPFAHYQYSIFEAEIASTFHEQLLAQYWLKQEEQPIIQAALANRQLDAMVGTIFRQMMFFEFEKIAHHRLETQQSLELQDISLIYKQLQEKYFGSAVRLPPQACLEALRIPHFYNAFYVYKYSTGLISSLYFSQQVLSGVPQALSGYEGFLKSGGRQFPLDNLKNAGLDLSSPEAFESFQKVFQNNLDILTEYTG